MPVVFNEATSGDTTHANHPTLSYSLAGSTVVGTLDHTVDPVFGLTTDRDFYQFMLGTGSGQIARGSFVTVTFAPPGAANYFTDLYSARVTYRIDTDANLHSSPAYPGSNGTVIRHDNTNPNGPFTVTFQVPTEAEVAGNAIEFSIEGFSNTGTFADLSYQVTFGGQSTSADLTIVDAAAIPSSVVNGGTLLVRYSMTNAGLGTAQNPNHGIFLSTDAVYDQGDILLDMGGHQDLGPNASLSTSADVRLPGNLVSGTFYIIVVADPDNAISEGSEGNNYYAIPITITNGIASGGSNFLGGTAQNQAFAVQSSTGSSLVSSGGGDDYIASGIGGDVLYAGAGRDVVNGGDGADIIFGDTDILEDNDATGAAGSADQLIGGAGADFIYAGAGGDYINAESGDDVVFGQAGDDLVYGGAGNDRMFGGIGNDQMWGGTESTLRSSWFGSPITVNFDGTNGNSIASQQVNLAGVAQTVSTGNDFMDGGDGNDRLDGQDGNDTLIGGAGIDSLFGGDGDDTVVWDAVDDLANVLGGIGNDTLLVLNQAAPTSFNLSSHGFERANVVIDDAGGNWWLQVSDYYNANWQRTNSDTRSDNGNLVQTSFDVSPGGTGVNWQYISDYRGSSNVLTNQDGKFDDGGSFSKSYDYATGTGVDGISDELREFTYFFRDDAERALSKVNNVEGFYDDGRKFTQTNDVDNNKTWTFQTNWYEANGTTLDFLEIRWDNGSTQIIPY